MVVIRFIRNVLAVLWLIIGGTLGSLILILTPSNRLGMLYTKHIFSPMIFVILRVKVSVTGFENIDPEKNYVFTANHQSHLDTPAIFWKYPKILYFIAKQELRKAPVVGWFISLSGMLFVDRRDSEKAKESLAKAADMIRNGKNIISFPEGTRSKDGNIKRFNKGLFQLAIAAETDVVPVSVDGAHEAWPSGTFRTQAGHIRIHFGKPISHRNYENDPIKFANDTREIVIQKCNEMKMVK